jgi:hypothetical protein
LGTLEGFDGNLDVNIGSKNFKEDFMSVQLKYEVQATPIILTVDRMPVIPPSRKAKEGFVLAVQNESRTDFRGQARTGQLFEFVVHPMGQPGAIVWKYSDGKVFPQIVTPVEIAPGKVWEEATDWEFAVKDVKDGHYVVIATFMATNETVKADFEIKSLQ